MPQSVNVFDFEDYKDYLRAAIPKLPRAGHGFRSHLADNLKCQTSFVSNVIGGSAQFSAEHGLVVSKLLGHTPLERKYFLLLIQRERAGSHELKSHFSELLDELTSKRLSLRERIQVKRKLGLEEQIQYYSEWYYAAIHMLCCIPHRGNVAQISKDLRLLPQKVLEILNFLVRCGLIVPAGNEFKTGSQRLHLSSDSPLISKHHQNWRIQSLKQLERATEAKDNLHYTSLVTISKKDAAKIKAALIEAIEKFNSSVEASGSEECYSLHLDFFPLLNAAGVA